MRRYSIPNVSFKEVVMRLKNTLAVIWLCVTTAAGAQQPTDAQVATDVAAETKASKSDDSKAKSEARKERRAHRRAVNHHHRRKH